MSRFLLQYLQKCKNDLTFFMKSIISCRFQIRWKSLKEVLWKRWQANQFDKHEQKWKKDIFLSRFIKYLFVCFDTNIAFFFNYANIYSNTLVPPKPLYTIRENFVIKSVLLIIPLYQNLELPSWKANEHETAQKKKKRKFFYIRLRLLEIKFATMHQREGEPSC